MLRHLACRNHLLRQLGSLQVSPCGIVTNDKGDRRDACNHHRNGTGSVGSLLLQRPEEERTASLLWYFRHNTPSELNLEDTTSKPTLRDSADKRPGLLNYAGALKDKAGQWDCPGWEDTKEMCGQILCRPGWEPGTGQEAQWAAVKYECPM